jgi:hypothetical protein
MKIEIKSRWNGSILFAVEADNWRLALEAAVGAKANLRGADLREADLGGANLREANLGGADLREANLREADLGGANLRGANLGGANLGGADLGGANLREANLGWADLREANLREANLGGANLGGANLGGADLREANLGGADLREANMGGAKNAELVFARTSTVPDCGPFFGWKKCRNNVIVKLFIPSKARRSNATGRKCRAERAKVLEVMGAESGVSLHTSEVVYETGKWVHCDKWEENRWVECGGGIHFYITRAEAEAHE